MSELKKCLKCSDEMEVVKASNGFYYLCCKNCMLQFGDENNIFESREELLEAWNTRTNEQELKDHEIAQIVNNLRDIAVQYHNYECLREKIAGVIVPALKTTCPKPRITRERFTEIANKVLDNVDLLECERKAIINDLFKELGE